MWFLLGFFSLSVFVVGMGYRRYDASWSGERQRTSAGEWEYEEHSHRGSTKWFRFGIAAPKGYDFALKPESSTDGFFKSIGISTELEVSDAAFDRAIYIVSDDADLCRRLSQLKELRQGLLDLFSGTGSDPYELKGLRCAAGRIWLRYGTRRGFETPDAHRMADRAVPVLRHFAKTLGELPAEPARRDPFVFRAFVLLAISTGLFANGLAQLYRIYWNELPFLENPWSPVFPSLLLGAILVVVLCVAAMRLLGRGARTHLVLLEILIFGSLGGVANAYAELRDLNMEFDSTPPKVLESQVLGKRVGKSRRGGSRYYIKVVDWNRGEGTREQRIPYSAFNALRTGDPLKVNVKPGFAGYAWVESIEGPNSLRID